MKIVYYKGECPNFGDDLNLWLWPKILPDFFNESKDVYFIGIGSTIGLNAEEPGKKIVFGAGFVPSYRFLTVERAASGLTGADWHVYFVRGPRTAKLLNLSPEYAITDSAMLIRTVLGSAQRNPDVISFIPHWQSLARGNWELACEYAGINLIDPRNSVDTVLAGLLRSKFVIVEAMHGAIVADALRVPWVPVVPIQYVHREKWLDWADSMGVTIRANSLWPSSLKEARMLFGQSEFVGSLRRVLKRNGREPNLALTSSSADKFPQPSVPPTGNLHTAVDGGDIAARRTLGQLDRQITYLAAHRLAALTKIEPTLSTDANLDRVTERMLDKVQLLRKDYGTV